LRTFLALKFLLVIKIICRAFGTFLAIKKWESIRAINTLLFFYIVYLLMRAKLASFVSGVKKLRMEALYTLISSKVFFLKRTLTLFTIFIVNLFERTFLACFN
jgi:hypothetical protein